MVPSPHPPLVAKHQHSTTPPFSARAHFPRQGVLLKHAATASWFSDFGAQSPTLATTSSFGSGGERVRRGRFASFTPRSFASLRTRLGWRSDFGDTRPEQASNPAAI